MRLARKVKEFAKLSDTTMHRLLRTRSLQAYQWFEAHTKTLSVERCMMLEKIYIENGGTKADFEALRKKFGDK